MSGLPNLFVDRGEQLEEKHAQACEDILKVNRTEKYKRKPDKCKCKGVANFGRTKNNEVIPCYRCVDENRAKTAWNEYCTFHGLDDKWRVDE